MKKISIGKAKLNIATTLLNQLVAAGCGILIPRILITAFGSAMYGLTTSIAQFLSYIAILEGGIGRVARAELYRPLARKDDFQVSRVYHAIKHFFGVVGLCFLAYTGVLSVAYHHLARVEEAGAQLCFLLIWVISISTMAKYLGGLANLTLMNADQKQYIVNAIVMVSTVLNVLMVWILTGLGGSILQVKIGSSLVYLLQPLCYALYVRRHYRLPDVGADRSKLEQKWTGLGQHIAYFLHTNTDVVLLTLFADIRLVAVYTVYRLVISNIRKIAGSFTGGMEALFGERLAKQDLEGLRRAFRKYKFMLSAVTAVLFGTTAVLIFPFIRLYTAGVTDAEYMQPAFALVILLAEAIDCMVHPCASLPVAANQLKQTRWGAYGEAAVNIGLSLALIRWNPLLGIALGTLAAALFKAVFYKFYAAAFILKIRIWELVKNFLFTGAIIGLGILAGVALAEYTGIENYAQWALAGVAVFGLMTGITVLVSRLIYPQELKAFCQSFLRKQK